MGAFTARIGDILGYGEAGALPLVQQYLGCRLRGSKLEEQASARVGMKWLQAKDFLATVTLGNLAEGASRRRLLPGSAR